MAITIAIYVFVAINAILSLTATIANPLIILAIFKTPTLHTPSNVLLCSLALSDFGVGLLVQPMFMVFLTTTSLSMRVVKTATFLFAGASFFTMTAITVDRYLALLLHLRYQTIVTNKRTLILTFIIWIANLLVAILNGTRSSFKHDISSIVISFVSLVLSSYCHIQIYRIVKRHKREILKQTRSISLGYSSSCLPRIRQGKSIANLYYIHGLFISCCTPYLFVQVCSYLFDISMHDIALPIYFTTTLIFLNSTLNPFLFCWRVQDIRLAVKDIFKIGKKQ
ncbi:adenosine receptor A3-like [Actinia tenebrosa]|uniref:Adenosine receptor A3-like n=1 Tax=Actinia tenebrosa TaxID=6105 RepID=A0A6P8H9E8_ACTTE|nr:adenosine receptor A3-like [Actinia tenebrosa]